MIKDLSIIPVILSGGTGTRIWPLSRESFPKQFHSISGGINNSLLQKTYKRLIGLKNIENPIIICNEEHRFLVAEQMRDIKVSPLSIILEPFGKNTAPAITIAALQAIKFNSDPILLILSADHEIEKKEIFQESIKNGINYSNKGEIVTFGVKPTSPETGYGYIETFKISNKKSEKAFKVKNFVEKPDQKKANSLIKNKNIFWNSGIFMVKASVILNEIEKFQPKVFKYCKNAFLKRSSDLDFQRLHSESFSLCPDISIDVAVMEKTNLATLIPINTFWSDVGSWKSIWEISNKDENSNAIQGNVLLRDTKNSYLRSDSRLIVGIGLNNLIVIDTFDALLIANKNCSQEIKNIVKELKENNIKEGLSHKKIYRPWGNYFSLAENSNWKVKLIEVKPGEQLSLQKHQYRSEHWVIVNGIAKVEVGKEEFILKKNQSTYIPKGTNHRLSNFGETKLEIIEVQNGEYLEEDDILRIEDKYGR